MSTPFWVIPSFTFPPPPTQSVEPATGVNSTATSVEAQQLTLAAIDAPLRYWFGTARIGALIAMVVPQGIDLLLLCVHGKGPIGGIDAVEFDNKPAPPDVTWVHYTGAPGQGIDPWLAGALISLGVVYTDTLPGIAYTVLRLPPSVEAGFDSIAFVGRGLKVYDPRENRWTWSNTLSNAAWSNNLSALVQGALAPDGSATAWTITDSTAAAFKSISRTDTVAADTATHRRSFRVKKTSGGTSPTLAVNLNLTGGTALAKNLRLNTDTGFDYGASGAWTMTTDDRDPTFWVCTVLITNNGTNTSLAFDLFPAAGPYGGGGDSVTATGSQVVCWFDASRLDTSPADPGYTPTTAAAITPVTGTSDNPALALAHVVTSLSEGRGETVDWPSVSNCANRNDEVVSGAKRRTLSLVVNEPRDIDQWEKTLETYAGCWAVREGGTVFLVPDAPAASSFSFVKSKQRLDTIDIDVRNRKKSPTVVTVRYTNTAVSPWATASATVKADGVDAGTVPYQEAVVDLPGIVLPGHAYREAIRRLNEAQFCDISVGFVAVDAALKLRKYDVIDLTDGEGFTAKPFRLMDASILEPGRWKIQAVEYQSAVYSNATTAAPTIGDTDLPDPKVVATPADLAIVETVYLEKEVAADSLGRGLIYQSRFDVSWTASVHRYPVTYRIQFLDGAQIVHEGATPGTSYASPTVQQGKNYTVRVYARNSLNFESDPATGSQVALGKELPPGDVPAITAAFEIGGEVIVAIEPAIDIDVIRYEWRYGPTGGFAWATATLIDQVDSLRARFLGLPVGTWRFAVKAIDSVGHYSANPATVDITITSDADAFIQSRQFTSPTLTNMVEIPPLEGVGARRWATSMAADAWNSVMPNPVNSGGNPVISYHASGTSRWQGESWDLGSTVSGTWSLVSNASPISGSISVSIETSPDGSTWTPQPGSVWTGPTRFVRPVMQALTSSTMLVSAPPAISFTAQARSESDVVTTLASGGKLVQLLDEYASVKDLQATPINATASRTVIADRILVHPEVGLMLAYDFNGAGDNYLAQQISALARVIAAGDHLEWDVFIDSGSPVTTTYAYGGGYIYFTDATDSGAAVAVDGYSASIPAAAFDALARGQWVSRKVSLAAYVGKTSQIFAITCYGDAASGSAKVLYRNLRITDGAGTTRATVWASGEPSVNAVIASALVTNVRCGPANSFNLYAFNSGGTQVAQDVRYNFRGF